MCEQPLQMHSVGTLLKISITNQDGEAENLSTATSIKFSFLKPDKTTVSQNGEFFTDGTDGIVQYIVDDEDFLDKKGKWKLQVYVVLSNGNFYSSKTEFEVDDNIINY